MKQKLWGLNYFNMAVALLFAAIGLYTRRLIIVIISLCIFAIGIWAKMSSHKFGSADKIFWNQYIMNNRELKGKRYISWHYGKSELESSDWNNKVREGKIRAISYFEPAFPYESNPKPRVGEYSVIKDWHNNPQFIIETMSIETISFREVTEEQAFLEGYNSLSEWQKIHKKEYQEICRKININFTNELPVMFEHFEVVYHK